MNFSHREKLILRQLSNDYPKFVMVEDIAENLNVSVRTIQRDLKQLELSLQPFNVEIIKKQNEGISLSHDHVLSVVDDILNSDNIDLNQVQRVIAIYQELMFNDDFTTSNYLSSALNVSIYTINQDLDLLSEMISSANLVISKKPGVGLELEGLEKDKRNGFAYLMGYYYQKENFFSISKSEFKGKPFPSIQENVLQDTQHVLFEEIKLLPYNFTDNSLYDLWMYLVITVLRFKNHQVEPSRPHDDLCDQVARNIIKRFNFKFELKINENEIYYIANLLRSGKRVNEVIDIEKDNLVLLASDLIDYVTNSTGYYIKQTPQFLQGLITHLRPLLKRLQEGVFVANPIKDKIKENYPLLFSSISQYFKQHAMINVNDDEIGFLTLHFGVNIDSLKAVPNIKTLVICTSGIATSRMLTQKLLDYFPQLTIIEQSSLLELAKMNLDEYDLIISTVKLHDPTFDYIHVSPMLEIRDREEIESKVNHLLLQDKRDVGSEIIKVVPVNLEDIFIKLEEVVNVSQQAKNNFRVIESNYLSYEAFVLDLDGTQALKDDLLNKHNQFGFGVPKTQIALVHTRFEDVDEVIIRVYQNRSDIIMKTMDHQKEKMSTLILMLTPLDLTNEQLEVLSFVSINLFETNYVKIYTSESESTVTNHFVNQLSQSLKNTINKFWR